jgi:molybdate transport system substrate-binding protein
MSGRVIMKESSAKKLVVSGLLVIILLGIAAFLTVPHGTEEKPVTITVSAASSLTEAFGGIVREFETSHPNTKIELNLAGSGTLRTQIESGAPVDVFASASERDMDRLSEKGLIQNASRKNFAANTLVMIVPAKSTFKTPEKLEDLTTDNIEKIAIGNPESAPVGKYTKQALETAGIWEKIQNRIILAENVKQVLTYVETGEADAGFVYMTDARNEKENLSRVVYTVPVNEPISYPIAVVKFSENAKEAQEFIDFVIGNEGQEILVKCGFELP